MQDFIKWLEMNYTLVIDKLKKNKGTFIDLEAEVVILDKILCPSTALELAEIYEEYLNTIAVLEVYEVNVPKDVRTEVIELSKEGLTKLTELAKLEAKNNGNLLLFINAVIEKTPLSIDVVNVSDNMISLDFKTYEEGVAAQWMKKF